MQATQDILLGLIRNVIDGTELVLPVQNEDDVLELAAEHRMLPTVLECVNRYRQQGKRIFSKRNILRLSMSVDAHIKEQKELVSLGASFLKEIGFPCVVLKGADYARFWPNPEWRMYGDLDIVPIKHNREEVNRKAIEVGCKIHSDGYYKHSELVYREKLCVECHESFTMHDGTRQGNLIEVQLNKLLNEGEKTVDAPNQISPCREFTALFMLVHAHQHFFFDGLTLTHVLDWFFFLRKEGGRVDWQEVVPVMKDAGIGGFYDMITACCVKWLGLKTSVRYDAVDGRLLELFWNDVLRGEVKSDLRLQRLSCRFQRMWRYRAFLGSSIVVRAKNAFLYNYMHKKPK